MIEKLATLWPELVLMIGGTICLLIGLAKTVDLRQYSIWVAVLSLLIAAGLVPACPVPPSTDALGLGSLLLPARLGIAAVGVVLVLAAAYTPLQVKQAREAEAAAGFQPGDALRGEFYFFLLFSLAGAMLCVSADGLPWLFLALELTSLPTYVMVAVMRDKLSAQESGVKYFFLGALAAAVFLFGFSLMYGATGATSLSGIHAALNEMPSVPDLFTLGLAISVIGICFKIAAFPMHFYTPDVYEGATASVTGYLAFVPKAAGFVSLALLLGTVGWPLPGELALLLATVAAITMCLGNCLGLVQHNVKRVLAYSSVAHSGYMLLGLLAGHAGITAVVFYLLAYGSATVAAFAALGVLQVKRGDADPEEAETYEDLQGLISKHPLAAIVIVLSMISLIGLPPLAGFFGKFILFLPAIEAGYTWLVVLAVINSAVSAAYYLKIASTVMLGQPPHEVTALPSPARKTAAVIAVSAAVALGFLSGPALNAISPADAPADEVAAAE